MRFTRALGRAVAAVLLTAAAAAPLFAAPQVTSATGIVQVMGLVGTSWRNVDAPHRLALGDKVRTGSGARATVTFDDGSRVELGPDSSFIIEDATGWRVSVRMGLGRMKAVVNRLLSRRFEVMTPTAVCSVRGTEFSVTVLSGGRTLVDLYKGLLGVEDNRGQQILLHPNERLSVDLRGMGVPEKLPSGAEIQRTDLHASMKREVALDMGKEEVLAAAAREIKLSEYQQGKALIDVNGKRVRVEEYIVRPRADQFKLVVLNKRDAQLDYFYYQGTFNKALPTDMSSALRQLGGGVGAAPEYFLTAFETGRSNTADSIRELAAGGHLVDVNSNADATDNVKFFFDAAKDRYEDVSGKAVFQTLFDRYGFYLNSKLKYGWTGNNIQSYAAATQSSNTDPITGAALSAGNAYLVGGVLATRTLNVTFPSADKVHQRITESYSDGSFLVWDHYIIDDQGRVASVADFSGITSGTAFKKRLLDFNFEQVISATEFQGRKIDLVVEPRILIQAGLIQ